MKFEIDEKELRYLVYGQLCDLQDKSYDIGDKSISMKIGPEKLGYSVVAFRSADRVRIVFTVRVFNRIADWTMGEVETGIAADFVTKIILSNE